MKQACQVLYAKYNSLRRPDFRVTTEICEDESGLFVRKRAGEGAARNHLDDIQRNGLALRDYYGDIRVIPSQRGADGLRFPYLRGRTLAEQIDAQDGDRERFIAQVNDKLARVLSVRDQYRTPFVETAESKAMFGRVDLGDVPALNPANIDSLFSNFIENDEGVWCVDCEWVCHFPVPIDFIKYRVLTYLYVNQARAMLDGATMEDMLGWFGFSSRERELYGRMEDSFQQYIHGKDREYIYTERYRKDNLLLENFDMTLRARISESAEKDRIIREKDALIRNLIKHYPSTVIKLVVKHAARPLKGKLEGFKKSVRKRESLYLFLRFGKDTLRHGPGFAGRRLKDHCDQKRLSRDLNDWPSEAELTRQRDERFPRDIRISILVPLYNTPGDFLREMIGSVRAQSYANWELCLADGSDGDHGAVGEYCREAARADERIKYKKLDENMGISGNTNACIGMAAGEYIALFDHDDILHPSALYEVMKAICEQDADYVYTDEATFESPNRNKIVTVHYKPDFAPDNLLANNYICHLSVFSARLIEAVGGFRHEYDGSQDHDIILRLTEAARRVVHVPKVLYWWRAHPKSVAQDIGAKAYAVDSAKRAVRDFLREYRHVNADVQSTQAFPTIFRIVYPIERRAKVSIVIPNKDHVEDLKRCVDSIRSRSTYGNYEIVVVENNSGDEATFRYYEALTGTGQARVLRYEGPFNYSRINNWAVRQTDGEYVVLLNNDTEVITPDWLESMLMYAQRGDVGAVGAKLYFPNDTIQHAGIILKLGADRVAGHAHYGAGRENLGYMGRLCYAQDVSAVTAACLMVRRDRYDAVGGLNEELTVALNDVDFCLKLREKGYLNIFTPFAELRHYESATRGTETGENEQRYKAECDVFRKRWAAVLEKGDPYYNPNFSLDSSMFEPIRHAT